MFTKIGIVIIGLVLAVSVSACGRNTPAPSPNVPTTPPTSPAGTGTTTIDASTVYKQNCVSCHGVDLGGAVGTNLQNVGSRYSADQIAAIITNGRNAMPSFENKLKAEEIDALSVWLAAKK